MYLSGFFLLSGLLYGVAFLGNGPSSLRDIVAFRGFFTGIRRSVSKELLDETNLVGAISNIHVANGIQNCLFTGTFALAAWFALNRDIDKGDDLRKWDAFSYMERRANILFLVFLTIMTKNIENAI